jgi:hypothetical protein
MKCVPRAAALWGVVRDPHRSRKKHRYPILMNNKNLQKSTRVSNRVLTVDRCGRYWSRSAVDAPFTLRTVAEPMQISGVLVADQRLNFLGKDGRIAAPGARLSAIEQGPLSPNLIEFLAAAVWDCKDAGVGGDYDSVVEPDAFNEQWLWPRTCVASLGTGSVAQCDRRRPCLRSSRPWRIASPCRAAPGRCCRSASSAPTLTASDKHKHLGRVKFSPHAIRRVSLWPAGQILL